MKVIYKYPLVTQGKQIVTLPAGAITLGVKEQAGILNLWALVDSGAKLVPRDVRIYGTGTEVDADFSVSFDKTFSQFVHLGTVVMSTGGLVWHVFVKTP